MTIIFVVDSFPCISETFILNQITGMIDLGHKVFIFSAARSNEENFHDDVRKYGLLKMTYYHNDKPRNKFKRVLWVLLMVLAYGHRNPKAVFNSLNFFKYGREALSLTYLYKVMLFLGVSKADILLCHYGPNGNFAALMNELGIAGKIVTMFHLYDIRRGIKTKDLYLPLFKRGEVFLSISDFNKKHLLEFGAPAEKVHYHPVGIDTQTYVSIRRKGPMGAVRILTVARLVPQKGLVYGIEAIHRLVYERGLANIEYNIIGDGPLRKELEGAVEKFQLKGKVHFLGYQNQAGVARMLGSVHLFFLPSLDEALPVVLMEAQAAGLPVVATDVGSVSQVMLDARSGYIVPAADVTAMCDKLEDLVRHPDQWETIGEAGKKYVQENYDIRKLNQRLAALFEKLIKP